jgi:hypothetical protein
MRAALLAAVALAATLHAEGISSTAIRVPVRGPARDSTSFEHGHAAYMDRRFDESRVWFERAVAESASDPRSHAWLGFAWFRLEQPEAAWREAHAALALDSCNTVAWEVLYRALDPQFGSWSRSDPESAWTCLRVGTRCDSLDGGLWESAWIGAQERGDEALVARSIRGMVEAGLYLGPLLANSRWTLADLPPRSILLINGDADCYPTLIVQQAERLRTDVTLVHLSMLALPWYRSYVRDRLGVPMPLPSAALDSLDFTPDGAGGWIPPYHALVAGWLRMGAQGSLDRPLAMAVTVEQSGVPTASRLRGGHWLLEPRSKSMSVDTAATRLSLMRLRAADFLGPGMSAAHRSPYSRKSGQLVRRNLVWAAYSYCQSARAAGDARRAEAFRRWARSHFGSFSAEELEPLRDPFGRR